MGAIADDLERSAIYPLQAIMGIRLPVMVPGTEFTAMPLPMGLTVLPGGPLQGVAMIDLTHIYVQLDELTKALAQVVKAVRKLEDAKPAVRGPIIGGHRR